MEEYDKIRILGTGSFGSAWLVKCKIEGIEYVSKEIPILSMQMKDRNAAINELKILGTLRHKNIVCYKDAFMYEKNLCILMEYADDGDLSLKIKQQSGKLFLELQIIDWFVQILVAVKYIHSLHILHRDIKSQNIFLTKSGLVKVGDFGISRMLGAHPLEESNAVIGTPYYLSPEICGGKLYNHKSDMWSLGVLLYELATLHHPFVASYFSDLKLKIIKGYYAPISNCFGPLLKDLIHVLLKIEAEKRPSAAQLLKVPALQLHLQSYLMKVKHKHEPVIFKCQMENDTTLTDIGCSRSGSNIATTTSGSSDGSVMSVDLKEENCEKECKQPSHHPNNKTGDKDKLNKVSTKSAIPRCNNVSAYNKSKPVKVNFIELNKVLAISPPERFMSTKISPTFFKSKVLSSPHRVFTRRVKSAPTPTCLHARKQAEERANPKSRTRSSDGKIPALATQVKRHSMEGILSENIKQDCSSTKGTDDTSKSTKRRSTESKFKFYHLRKRSRQSLQDNGDGAVKKVTKLNDIPQDNSDSCRKSPKQSVVICNESIVKDNESNVITNHSAIKNTQISTESNKENKKPIKPIKLLAKRNTAVKIPKHEEAKKQTPLHVSVRSRLSEQIKRQKLQECVETPSQGVNVIVPSNQPLHSTLKESVSATGMSLIPTDKSKMKMDITSHAVVELETAFATKSDDGMNYVKTTDNSYTVFTTPSKATSDRLRSDMEGIIEHEKLESVLQILSEINLSGNDFEKMWKAHRLLGFEHRWLLFNIMEIAQGEK